MPGLSAVLLGRGANPNLPGGGASTALMEAIRSGHGDLVPLLLKHKADPALKDSQGRTAADWAAKRDDERAAAALSGR